MLGINTNRTERALPDALWPKLRYVLVVLICRAKDIELMILELYENGRAYSYSTLSFSSDTIEINIL